MRLSYVKGAATLVVLCCLVSSIPVASAQQQAAQPAILVQVRNVRELLDDARYLGEVLGGPVGAGTVEGLIQQFAPEGRIPGVAETEPLGAFINFGQFADLQMPVFYVPIRDANQFRNFLKTIFPQEQSLQNDLYFYQSIEQAIYAKFTGRYCFLSLLPTAFDNLPDVARFPRPRRDIEVAVHLDRFPPDFLTALDAQLQIAMAQAEAAVEQQGEPQTPVEQAAERLGQQVALRMIRTLLTETATVALDLDVNQNERIVVGALRVVPRPDTAFASSVEAFGNRTSRFASVLSDNDLASVIFSSGLSEDFKRDVIELLTTVEHEVAQSGTPEEKRGLPLLQAIRQCLSRTESIDFALSARVTDSGSPLLVLAGSLADAPAIKRGILALMESDPSIRFERAAPGIDGHEVFVVESAGNGGNEVLAFTITDDAFYAAVADRATALAALKETYTTVHRARPVRVPGVLVTADIRKILEVGRTTVETETERQQFQLALDAMLDAPAHIRIVSEQRHGAWEMRLELEEGVLRALGVVAAQAAAEAQAEAEAQGVQ